MFIEMNTKLEVEIELRKRKSLAYTVLRPGRLTLVGARGVDMGRTGLNTTRDVPRRSFAH
jgi:hypothetical protein